MKSIQRIWRSMSKVGISGGFFVWDIVEVMGGNPEAPYYTKCADGSLILVQCYHFFIEKQAIDFMNDVEICEMYKHEQPYELVII